MFALIAPVAYCFNLFFLFFTPQSKTRQNKTKLPFSHEFDHHFSQTGLVLSSALFYLQTILATIYLKTTTLTYTRAQMLMLFGGVDLLDHSLEGGSS